MQPYRVDGVGMKTKILGRTGIEVSTVGLGAGFVGMAGLESGPEIVKAAVEAGCTLVDTAPLYGDSELTIGKAFKQYPELRDKCTVTTKAGRFKGGTDHSFDGILRSVEKSQERLGIEQFQIIYIHDAMGVPMENVMRKDGTLGALRKLQDEGIVRYIGSAANDPETNAPYIETGEFDVAVVPDAWSLINQTALEHILPAAEKHDVGIVCATPLETGLLATGASQIPQGARRNFSAECIAHVGKIEDLSSQYDIPLLAASLQWCSRHPQVATAIPGAKTMDEAIANAKAGELEIPDTFWDDLAPLIRHWEHVVQL